MSLLPTTKTKKKLDLREQIILIHGAPKIGKTTFISQFIKGLILATEPGTNAHEVYQVEARDWKTILDALAELDQLAKTGKSPYNMVMIDTIDMAYQYCTTYVCNQMGCNHPSDLPMGKGWAAVANELRRMLVMASQIPGVGLITVSHTQEREMTMRNGSTFTKAVPTLPESCRKTLLGLCDLIFYFTHQVVMIDKSPVQQRVIKTKSNADYEAGDRFGALPESIPMDYDTFIKAWTEHVQKTKPRKTKKEVKK